MPAKSAKLDQLPKRVPDLSGRDPVVKATSDKEAEDYERQKRKLELEGGKYELEARKTYGKLIFWLVTSWIAAVLILIAAAGYSEKPLSHFRGPTISDNVLIALITGMSVNVIALLAIVVSYLFPKRKDG